jgi:glycosyltransferase involved in cell wall biosynthesis
VKILFVLEHYHPYIGGAERLFLELTTALAREGHTVAVVTTRFRPDLPETETFQDVTIHRVTCRNRFLFSFLSLGRVWRLARGFDLIQTTSYNAALPAWLAGRLRRVPVIIIFHEVWGRLWWRLPYIPWVLRLAYFSWEQLVLRLPYHRWVAVSEATRQALQRSGIPGVRIVRIYNGLDTADLRYTWQPPAEGFIFTYYGRLGYSKGLDLLIPAALRFLDEHPEARCQLVIPTYPGGLFRRVSGQVRDAVARGRIQLFHDLDREELFGIVAASSCVVVPSYSEGFCFVAAEATAMGVPLIHSGRTALAEVAGGRSLLIEPFDPEGLYRALGRAREGDWEYREVRHFPMRDAVAAYLELYRQLLLREA